MKIAIVGFGFIAEKGHLPTYQKRSDLELVAVVDPVAARREAALNQYPGIQIYETLTELLQQDDAPEIDLIDICSPNAFHIDATQQALTAGKHVLCEKPLALNPLEFATVKALAQQQQRVLYPCHNYKFAPSVKHAASLVQGGAIGQPLFASFRVFRVSHAKGVAQWQPHWRRDQVIAGGGILVDHGVHAISIAQSLLGGAAKRVSAHLQNLGGDEHLTENTALFCLDWAPMLVQISLTWVGTQRKSSFRVQGTEGEICIDNDQVILMDKNQSVLPCVVPTDFDDPSHSSWFEAVINDVQKHIQEQNFSPASLREAGLVADIMEKANKSHQLGGCWVALEGNWS